MSSSVVPEPFPNERVVIYSTVRLLGLFGLYFCVFFWSRYTRSRTPIVWFTVLNYVGGTMRRCSTAGKANCMRRLLAIDFPSSTVR